MGRRPCCEKVGLNRGGWSALEDQILTNYIKANGEGKWRDLPKKAGLKRCGKCCRLRWLNYLNPKIIRGNITQEEEELIINLHKHLGNRWSLIAGRLPGRTDNEIKNYWNTILCRKVHGEQVVPKRKPRKKTHVKNSNSNSNSLPPRRVTVQIMCPVSEHIVTDPQAVPSETTDAIITPSEPVTLQENSADFIDQIMQNMDSIEESVPPLINFNEQCCSPQELAWSQKMNTEFMGDIMQNQANIEGPQSPGSENCYTREDSDEFMGDIMQPIANLKSPPSLVYEKCYHDLMSDLGSEEICMPEMDEYFRYSYQDILSDLTVTLEDSMFDHWMGDTPKEENNTFDLGSSATLF